MKMTFTNGSATIGSTEFSLPANSTTLAAQTDDAELEVWIDLANMAAGDQFRFRLYEKINGGTARVAWEAYRTGVQSGPLRIPKRVVGEGWDATVKKEAGADCSISWSLRKLVEGETVAAVTLAANAITAAATAADFTTEVTAGLATAAGVTSAVAPLALSTQVDALEAAAVTTLVDLDDIQSRLPATLVDGRMDASVGALAADVLTAIVAAVWTYAHDALDASRNPRGVLSRLDGYLTGKLTGAIGATAAIFGSDGTTKLVEFDQDVEAGTRDAATTVEGD